MNTMVLFFCMIGSMAGMAILLEQQTYQIRTVRALGKKIEDDYLLEAVQAYAQAMYMKDKTIKKTHYPFKKGIEISFYEKNDIKYGDIILKKNNITIRKTMNLFKD